MATIICTVALLACSPAPFTVEGVTPLPPARGGHATAPPARGGHATVVLEPIGRMADWVCIHEHEGAWNDTGDPYWGGLQMDREFMATYGADMERKYNGYADSWAPRDQMVVAQRAYDSGRGYAPWPNTARMCGLL